MESWEGKGDELRVFGYLRSELLWSEKKKPLNNSHFERKGKEKGYYFRDYYRKALKWRHSRIMNT